MGVIICCVDRGSGIEEVSDSLEEEEPGLEAVVVADLQLVV